MNKSTLRAQVWNWVLLSALAVLAVSAAALSGEPPAAWQIETVAGNGQAGPVPPSARPLNKRQSISPSASRSDREAISTSRRSGSTACCGSIAPAARSRASPATATRATSGDGGPAGQAQLNEPYEVRFDARGNMFFVEMQNHLIRHVDASSHAISTIAGTPQPGYAGDGGPAREAQFPPAAQHRARRPRHALRLPTSATIASAASIWPPARSRRSPATASTRCRATANSPQGQPIFGPRAMAIVGRTMWIALREGNSVWRLDLDSGIIRHAAGSGAKGYSGDGGPAIEATFNGPKGIAATADGLLYVVDTENQVIRLIDSNTGLIHTVAGAGPQPAVSPATPVRPWQPTSTDHTAFAPWPTAVIYIGDTNNHRVRRLHK